MEHTLDEALPADHPTYYCDMCGYYHNDLFDCQYEDDDYDGEEE